MIDQRNTRNEKNAQTQRERDTAADMDEARADGDDDDEGGNNFYFTTGSVKRM